MADMIYSKLLSTDTWDRASISINKPYIYNDPIDAAVAFVSNGWAYLTTITMDVFYIPGEIRKIGPAVDVSVCYDLRWRLQPDGTYAEYTFGDPFITYVDTSNRLYVKHGMEGAEFLLDTGVTKCFLCRGWRHISDAKQDQGVICFYVKNSRLYSRSYYLLEDGNYGWSVAEQYEPYGVKDVYAKRTVDYRVAIVVITSYGNKLLLTTRQWAGQAVPTETINAQFNITCSAKITQIGVRRVYETETIKTKIVKKHVLSSGHIAESAWAHAFNTTGTIINLNVNILPSNESMLNASALKVTDSKGYKFTVTNIKYQFPYLVCTVSDFNNAEGDITINYVTGWNQFDGSEYPEFSCTFTPTGLVPVPPDPPVLVSIKNVDSEVV